MDNFIISLNVVLPLFLSMALGYGLKYTGLFDEKSLKVMNNSVFRIFLPTMLFYNIYTTDIGAAFNPRLLAFAVVTVLVIFFTSFLIVPRFEKDNKKKGVLIQGIFRSNFIIFGIPLIESLYGSEGTGVAAILIAVVVPMYNVMAVISLSVFLGKTVDYKKIAKNIITNPLIISSALGLLCLLLKIHLPQAVEKTVKDLAGVATPLGLVVLGASFDFKKTAGDFKRIFAGVFGRLVLVPAIFLPIAAAFGFRNEEMMALLAMYCAPTAVSSFTMAQSMGSDGDLAAALLVYGAAFSVITMFLFTYGCISLGWL